jgi:hypothetical protein
VLEVRGRTEALAARGLAHGAGKLFLVARGFTQWVRNAETSATSRSAEAERQRYRLGPDGRRKPPILKAYLDRFRQVQRADPAGSSASSSSLASRYPAYELIRVD